MRENHLDPRSPGFDSLYRSLLLLIFSFCYCIRKYSVLSLTATLKPLFVAPLILLEVFALLSKRAESLQLCLYLSTTPSSREYVT
ncbi:hypothetical protein BKA60DRAFT_556656 [Fusarium oxysporum]|nr:hypothetical protein BKA60DRAFT_556656 [Fusarium oxysporum]